MVPSDPYTAKGLLAASIRDDDPVIYFIHKRLMSSQGFDFEPLRGSGVPEEPYIVPIGKADVVKEGTDVTIVGIGHTTAVGMAAAGELDKAGVSAEVVDVLSLSPLDEDTLSVLGAEDAAGNYRRRGLSTLRHIRRYLGPGYRAGL